MNTPQTFLVLGLAAGCAPSVGELEYDQTHQTLSVWLDADGSCRGGPSTVLDIPAQDVNKGVFSPETSLRVRVEGWSDYTLERVRLVVDESQQGMETQLRFNQTGFRNGDYEMSPDYFVAFHDEIQRAAAVNKIEVDCR